MAQQGYPVVSRSNPGDENMFEYIYQFQEIQDERRWIINTTRESTAHEADAAVAALLRRRSPPKLRHLALGVVPYSRAVAHYLQ